MDDKYLRHVRRDIEPLLPAMARRIVDVGAGVGATSAWLRSRWPDCHIIGLEGNAAIERELARNVDEPVIIDLNGPLPDLGSPDLVLCLDVLEHLVRPGDVLARLTSGMVPEGTLIVSLPNVAHASVSLPLLLKGRFEYKDAGILDRTHLHFFDQTSAITLMNQAGFVVTKGVRGGMDGPRTRLIDRLACGMLRNRLAKQFILAGQRNQGVLQSRIVWFLT